MMLIFFWPDFGQKLDFRIIWELGGQERVQNTLTGCGIIFHYRGLDSEDFDFLTFGEFANRLPFPNLSITKMITQCLYLQASPIQKGVETQNTAGEYPQPSGIFYQASNY